MEELEFPNIRQKSGMQLMVTRWLARIDPMKAAALAESIEGPAAGALALFVAADALPERERNRKLALLDAAAAQAKAATEPSSKAPRDPISRFYRMGEVAERWYLLGEKEKAKSLLAEGLRLSNQTPRQQDYQEYRRGRFAARLARVDLPSALAIAKQFPASGRESKSWVLRNIALDLAADNPAEAERVLRQIPPETVRDWFPPTIAWKMAAVDPARARRLTDESQRTYDHPQSYLFLALGLKSRDEAAAHQAFQTAMQGIDRLMNDGADHTQMLGFRRILLPIVEQIDPALVPELFWRIVATRPSSATFKGSFLTFWQGCGRSLSTARSVTIWILSKRPDHRPSNTSSPGGIAFVSGSIWDRANRVTQACHLKRVASKTRPPNWPYRRFYRSPLSMPLDTSVGDPLRVAKVSLRKVAGQIGGLRLPRSNRGLSSFIKMYYNIVS